MKPAATLKYISSSLAIDAFLLHFSLLYYFQNMELYLI